MINQIPKHKMNTSAEMGSPWRAPSWEISGCAATICNKIFDDLTIPQFRRQSFYQNFYQG